MLCLLGLVFWTTQPFGLLPSPNTWGLAPCLLRCWTSGLHAFHLLWQAWAFDFWKSLTSSTQIFSMTSSWPSTVYPAPELYLFPCPGWHQRGRGYGWGIWLCLISSSQLWEAQRESLGMEVSRAQGIHESAQNTTIHKFREWRLYMSDRRPSQTITKKLKEGLCQNSFQRWFHLHQQNHHLQPTCHETFPKICKTAFMVQSNNNLIKPNIYNGRI